MEISLHRGFKVNAVIYQVEGADMTDEEKNLINAELRGLRAYYYYNLLDLFGNVPIITNYEDLEMPTNSSRADVYNFVETELLEILEYLPEEIIYGRLPAMWRILCLHVSTSMLKYSSVKHTGRIV
jgi:hypothetical protein